MRLVDEQLRLSPTDLGNHRACAHLTQLELRVQRGELERPHVDDPYGEIIMRKGNEHEAAYLARLEEGADGTTRLVGSTSAPDWYAAQLAALPVPFRIVNGPELRSAVEQIAQRLTAAAG